MALVAVLVISLAVAATAAAETATRTFFATEEALVPPGVTSIHVKAFGGRGGSNARGANGGQGARVEGQLGVTPGETLYVHVGGNGADATAAGHAGAGGGATDVRTSPVSAGLVPDPRLIVAAGGGGAGGQPATGVFGPGSDGGNAEQQGATPENLSSFGGEPGTQTAGGEGGQGECPFGTGNPSGENGALETGGIGGFCSRGELHGGQGGYGYYGGGGGGAGGPPSVTREGAAGGGGGSSLVPAGGSAHLGGTTAPQVQISYTQPPNPPAAVTGAATNVIQRAATLNATVDPEDREVTSCVFEYGETEAYGQTAACSSAPGSGVSPVAVSARPEGLSAATTYHFRIVATNVDGTAYGADATFRTLLHNPPTVTSLTPQTGPASGGTSVTITGTDLTETTAVNFGSTPAASFTIESDETITAVAPAEAGGTVDLRVTTPYGTSPATSADRYTVVPRPGVWRMKPKLGPEAGGTTVTIEGEHLTGASAVRFAGTEASSFKVLNGSVLEAVAPPGVATVDVTVSVPVGGTSAVVQGDRFGYETGAPEFGRCLHAPVGVESFRGGFSTETCTTVSLPSNVSAYEWDPGAAKPGFTASSTKATLQAAVSKAKVACTSAHESGLLGPRPNIVREVVIRFGGCVQGTKKCTTAGKGEGEIETSVLEGRLGFENKEKKKVALALYPPGHTGAFVTYTCSGASPTTISGAVLALTTVDKMLTNESVKYASTEGKQKIQHFEGGETEVLVNQLGEAVGLALALTQTNEEPLEINAIY
ncbi:MAG TPA: IPT/TIG domain-containing protein [Solirubrobacteraceae bacterium]